MHWSYIFLALSLRYRDGSILLNCAITKDNQPKIEYHDHFQVKNISRNLQNTCFISLTNQSHLGITIVLHFCLFCVIAVVIFWWAKSLWLHYQYIPCQDEVLRGELWRYIQFSCPLNQSKFYIGHASLTNPLSVSEVMFASNKTAFLALVHYHTIWH